MAVREYEVQKSQLDTLSTSLELCTLYGYTTRLSHPLKIECFTDTESPLGLVCTRFEGNDSIIGYDPESLFYVGLLPRDLYPWPRGVVRKLTLFNLERTFNIKG